MGCQFTTLTYEFVPQRRDVWDDGTGCTLKVPNWVESRGEPQSKGGYRTVRAVGGGSRKSRNPFFQPLDPLLPSTPAIDPPTPVAPTLVATFSPPGDYQNP